MNLQETIEATPAQAPIEWGEPRPIETGALLPVPPLPDKLIPEPIRPFVIDTAYRMQVAPESVAIAVLTTLSAIIGSACRIRPKRLDDWTVTPNLWGLLVARPGRLKTPVLAAASNKLLAPVVSKARVDYEERLAEFAAKEASHSAQQSALKDRMKRAAKPAMSKYRGGDQTDSETLDALEEEFKKLSAPTVPTERRYSTQSATVEALHKLISENPRGVILIADEVMRLIRGFDRPGHESDRAFYLEGWTGGGMPFTHDTIGRGSLHCPSLTISVLGGTQPDKIQREIFRAFTDGENDGMVQRFQLAIYPDDRTWRFVDQLPDAMAKKKIESIVRWLDQDDFRALGAQWDEDGDHAFVRFAPGGYAVFQEWLTELETVKLAANDDPLILDHLAKYRSLMPSLALIFSLVRCADSPLEHDLKGGVSKEDAELAAGWCDFLEAHARRIYGLVGDARARAVIALAARIESGEIVDGFTVRNVYRKEFKWLSDKQSVEHACTELVHAGWLQDIKQPSGPQGGAPTVRFCINPKVRIDA